MKPPTVINLALSCLWYHNALVNADVFSAWMISIALKPIDIN